MFWELLFENLCRKTMGGYFELYGLMAKIWESVEKACFEMPDKTNHVNLNQLFNSLPIAFQTVPVKEMSTWKLIFFSKFYDWCKYSCYEEESIHSIVWWEAFEIWVFSIFTWSVFSIIRWKSLKEGDDNNFN